ncbi:hypothetical protein [Clostridium sp.]|uniref:hypothetical protein n=1 Tax=Clostridium sp. TaxID=1506 RepID=UPI001A3E13ED|nr:hypothetical protein [Clostridium sp.]MBK5241930.1 hypothetical protein [Clostridium sp.]
MVESFNEMLVKEITLYIVHNRSSFKNRLKAYKVHMSEKVAKKKYDKEKSLISYRRLAEQGIGLYLLQFPKSIFNINTINPEDTEEIAIRMECFYFKKIIKELHIQEMQ